jgi:hypothetical protein
LINKFFSEGQQELATATVAAREGAAIIVALSTQERVARAVADLDYLMREDFRTGQTSVVDGGAVLVRVNHCDLRKIASRRYTIAYQLSMHYIHCSDRDLTAVFLSSLKLHLKWLILSGGHSAEFIRCLNTALYFSQISASSANK